MTKKGLVLAACVLCFFVFRSDPAQERAAAAPPDLTLDAPARAQLIEAVIREMKEYYVFPEAAQQVEKHLRERMKEYEKLTSARELAKALTASLREVTHDKHVSLNFSAEPLPVRAEQTGQAEPTEQERQGIRNYGDAINYGFEKIERLPGNIGYIRLNLFFPAEYGGDTAVAAMKFVHSTEALIIDLRGNDGGHPGMIQLLASYFFGAEPVQLSGLFRRRTNATQQYWTLPYVPGERYLGKEVYILTSRRTFSGGEAFAYDLKNLKRAMLVGETTEGAANPRDVRRLNEHFWMGIPNARAVSPVTNTNWEGVGVKPDIEVSADISLKTAHLMALKKLSTSNPADDNLKKLIETVQRELEELKQQPTRK